MCVGRLDMPDYCRYRLVCRETTMLGPNPRICAELGEIVAGIGYMGPGTYQRELFHVSNHAI